MGTTTFSGPVVSNNGFVGSGTNTIEILDVSSDADIGGDLTIIGTTTLGIYTYTGLPGATGLEGAVVYCSNGASGAAVLAFSDGSDWLRCDTLAAVDPTNT